MVTAGNLVGAWKSWDIHSMNFPPVPSGSGFYARLTEALTDAGYPTTQNQIADLLKVSQPLVSKWKNDQAYPSKATAAKAAELCRVSLSWLFFGLGHKKDGSVDDMVWALMEAFDRLPLEQRKELVAYARFKAAQADPPASDNPDKH